MTKNQKILQKIYLPILLWTIAVMAVYTSLHYFLLVKWQIIELHDTLVLFVFPAVLMTFIGVLVVYPRVKLLHFRKIDGNERLAAFYSFAVGASFVILQFFTVDQGGELSHIKSPVEINPKRATQYIEIDEYQLLKNSFSGMSYSSASIDKYGQRIRVSVYFVCPMIADTVGVYDFGHPKNFQIWFAKKYSDEFKTRETKTVEGRKRIEEFIDYARYQYKDSNFNRHRVFVKVNKSDSRENYKRALAQLPIGNLDVDNVLFLEALDGDEETRGKNGIWWALGFFLFAQIIFLLITLNKNIKVSAFKEFNSQYPYERFRASLGFLNYLIPTRERYAVPLLIDLNLLVFILMLFDGVSFFNPHGIDLLKWGALNRQLVLEGEWWRLFSSMFLHSGIIHLGYNMVALGLVGFFTAESLSNRLFLLFYLLSGLAAAIVSLVFNAYAVAVGASGAIMGMYGIALALKLFEKKPGVALGNSGILLGFVVIVIPTLLMGFFTNADNAAHIGGLIGGFLIGAIWRLPSRIKWDEL